MKKRTKLTALLLALIFVLSLTSCGLVTVDEDKDSAKVVATVNGTDITKGEVMDLLQQYLTSSGYPEDYYDNDENAEEYATLKSDALDSLILQLLMDEKAAELGLDEFTDEETANIETEVNSFIDSTKLSLESSIISENEALEISMTDEEISEEVQRQFDEYLSSFSLSEDELFDFFKREELSIRLQNYIVEDIEVTAEDIQEYYDTNLESQLAAMEESPELYDLLEQYSAIMLYEPLPTYYVRHILVSILDDDVALAEQAQTQYSVATTDLEKEAALAIMEPAFQNIQPEVDEIVAKIDAGDSFTDLISEYNDDEGMAYYPDGYPVQEGAGTYIDSFEKAAISLTTPGEISDPIKTYYGYHILELVNIDPAGPIALEDKYDEIEAYLLYTEQNNTWNEAAASWEEEADVVRYLNELD